MPEPSALGDLTLEDIGTAPMWRVFEGDLRPGTSRKSEAGLVWSVSPGEWTVLGPRPHGTEVVDLTHVRTVFRLTGQDGPGVIAKLCALDLSDGMFGDGAAARSLLAGVASELVRHDRSESRSYLIIPSRSFGRYVHEVILDAGAELGLKSVGTTPSSPTPSDRTETDR